MRAAWFVLALAVFAMPAGAQTSDVEFFETKIRPVLATRCYGCHSSKLAAPKGELVLDTKAGLAKGGRLGAEVVPGKPADSRLIHALSHKDPSLAMHATLLNQLGMDHTKLTYRYAGRDFRLTDVYGEVVKDVLV